MMQIERKGGMWVVLKEERLWFMVVRNRLLV